MKLSIIQFETLRNKKDKNFHTLKKYCNELDSDILVFPELATTGYLHKDKSALMNISDSFQSDTINKFQKLSTSKDKIIVFGFSELVGEDIYNSAAILIPDATKSTIYRKTHLFYKERFVFNEGDTGFNVVEYNGLKLGTMICYDWRFPESTRALALKGSNLVVCPSNLVTGVWQNVMSARALENKVYMAVANKIGIEQDEEEKLEFNGESAIYSYDGSYLAKASANKEEVITADIYPELTLDKSFNEFNDIFKDRRPKLYS
ncbi:MAG: nitrilase-related carbon-nitrogen hydrolase [Chlorobiota bacterium]